MCVKYCILSNDLYAMNASPITMHVMNGIAIGSVGLY